MCYLLFRLEQQKFDSMQLLVMLDTSWHVRHASHEEWIKCMKEKLLGQRVLEELNM